MAIGNPSGEKVSLLQILMLLLSIYALGAVFVQSAFPLPEKVDSLLDEIDFFVCGVFFTDFCIRLYEAPSKRSFLKWGWLDLISSVPKFQIFRAGRLLRVIRILRMLRAIRSTKILIQTLYANRAKSTLVSVASISLVLAIFASIAILNLETAPDSNIKTASDALWWAATTITTVGYGDKFPVTAEGRVIAVFLMITGVGLFGTFTGFIASLFVTPDSKPNELQKLTDEIRDLKEQIKQLSEKQNGQERTN